MAKQNNKYKLTQINEKQALEILNLALVTGGDYAEVFIEDTTSTSVEMVSGNVDRTNTSMIHGVGMRIIKGNVAVNGTTTDTNYQSLKQMAIDLSLNFTGEQLVFPKKLVDTTHEEHVCINDERLDETGLELMNQASLTAKNYSPEISQVVCNMSKKKQEICVFSSDEIIAHDVRHNARISLRVVASDGKQMQTGNDSFGANQGMEFLDGFDVVNFANETAKIAVTMLHAEEMVGGEMPVVINNCFGGVILHEACGHSLEASSVARGTSVFCGKLGEKIASDIVTAVDSGVDKNAWGSLNVDDEGTKTKRTVLIENGILKSYLVDKRNSKKMNHPITGSSRRQSYRNVPTSRMTNTYFLNGKDSFEDIIKDTKYGLFAKSMGGGSVNPATGEFNFAVTEGYLIEDGKITRPVRGATLVGSGKDVLLRIDKISDNLGFGFGMCGSSSGSIPTIVGQPTIRVSHLTVGGRGGNK